MGKDAEKTMKDAQDEEERKIHRISQCLPPVGVGALCSGVRPEAQPAVKRVWPSLVGLRLGQKVIQSCLGGGKMACPSSTSSLGTKTIYRRIHGTGWHMGTAPRIL